SASATTLTGSSCSGSAARTTEQLRDRSKVAESVRMPVDPDPLKNRRQDNGNGAHAGCGILSQSQRCTASHVPAPPSGYLCGSSSPVPISSAPCQATTVKPSNRSVRCPGI